MRTIHKYNLNFDPEGVVLDIPRSKFLHFNFQDQLPKVWVEVDTEFQASKPVKLTIFPTGAEIPRNAIFLGTCLHHYLVWHLYEIKEQ